MIEKKKKTNKLLIKISLFLLVFAVMAIGAVALQTKALASSYGWGYAVPITKNPTGCSSATIAVWVNGSPAGAFVSATPANNPAVGGTWIASGNTFFVPCGTYDPNQGLWLSVWGASPSAGTYDHTFGDWNGNVQQFNWCCGFRSLLGSGIDVGYNVGYIIYLTTGTASIGAGSLGPVSDSAPGPTYNLNGNPTVSVPFYTASGPALSYPDSAVNIIDTHLFVYNKTTNTALFDGDFPGENFSYNQANNYIGSLNLPAGQYFWLAQFHPNWMSTGWPSGPPYYFLTSTDNITTQTAFQYFTVQQNLPDLTVGTASGCATRSINGPASVVAGTSATYSAWTCNIGNADAGTFVTTASTSGASVNSSSTTFSGGLAVGGGGISSFTTSWATPGTYTVTFTADSGNSVTESNKSNNSASISVNVTAPAIGVPTPTPISGLPCVFTSSTYGSSVPFSWSNVSGATSYDIQVSIYNRQFPDTNTGDFVNPGNGGYFDYKYTLGTNSTTGGPTWTSVGGMPIDGSNQLQLSPGTTYYWHVRANVGGTNGYWSIVSSFSAGVCPGNYAVVFYLDKAGLGYWDGGVGNGGVDQNLPYNAVSDNNVTQVHLDSTTGTLLPESNPSFYVFGVLGQTGAHPIYLYPNNSIYTFAGYYNVAGSGKTSLSSSGGWSYTSSIPVTKTWNWVYVAVSPATTINVVLFNDNCSLSTFEGDGVQNCSEANLPVADLPGFNVKLDGTALTPTATGNPYSFIANTSVDEHQISLTSHAVSSTQAWIVTKWGLGGAGSGTTYVPVGGSTFSTDDFTNTASPMTIYLGVEEVSFTLPPPMLWNIAPNNAPAGESNTVGLSWADVGTGTANAWVGANYSTSFNCPIVSGTLTITPSISGTPYTSCPPSPGGTSSPSVPGVSQALTLKITTSSVLTLSASFTLNASATIQGVTLTPSVLINLALGYPAWLQTSEGDLGSNGGINLKVTPSGQKISSYLAISGTTTAIPSALLSAKNWLVTPKYPFRKTANSDYTSLFSRFGSAIPASCQLNGDGLPTTAGVYSYSSSVDFGGAALAPGGCNSLGSAVEVIFIRGNLTLNSAWTTPIVNNPTIFIVSGDINIAGRVGTFADDGTPNIKALLLADGNIVDGVSNNRLNITGSVLYNLAGGGAQDLLVRDLSSSDATYPAEYILFDPSYYYLFRNYVGVSTPFFKEIQP